MDAEMRLAFGTRPGVARVSGAVVNYVECYRRERQHELVAQNRRGRHALLAHTQVPPVKHFVFLFFIFQNP